MKTTKSLQKGTCSGNIGARPVYDAKNSLMDEWHKRNPTTVVILSGDFADNQQFPDHQRHEPDQPEHRDAGRSARLWRRNALATCRPLSRLTMPGNAILITPFKTSRSTTSAAACAGRSKRNRNTTAWQRTSPLTMTSLLEDYGAVAFIDGITFARSAGRRAVITTGRAMARCYSG